MTRSSGCTLLVVTAVFASQMAFTAYAKLHLPQVVAAFEHLGSPSYSSH